MILTEKLTNLGGDVQAKIYKRLTKREAYNDAKAIGWKARSVVSMSTLHQGFYGLREGETAQGTTVLSRSDYSALLSARQRGEDAPELCIEGTV